MYAKAADIGSHGCMFVEDLSTGEYSGQQCYGPRSDEQSAEDIVEHQTTVEPDLANFGTVTFYGVGITDNGGYYAMSQLPHDYANMYACAAVKGQTCYQWGDWLARTTPIVNDPGDTPYDEYGVAFVNYS